MIAQQHAQRAERLDGELSAARGEVTQLRITVANLEEKRENEERIAKTITDLQQNIEQVS